MEAAIVEDKRKARLCDDCGHSAAMHQVDGLGPCTAAGCHCLVLLLQDAPEESVVDDDDAAV